MSFLFKLPYLEYVSTIGYISTMHLENAFGNLPFGSKYCQTNLVKENKHIEKAEIWVDSFITANRNKNGTIDDYLPVTLRGYSWYREMDNEPDTLRMGYIDKGICVSPRIMSDCFTLLKSDDYYKPVKLYRARSVIFECDAEHDKDLARKLEDYIKLDIFNEVRDILDPINNLARYIWELSFNMADIEKEMCVFTDFLLEKILAVPVYCGANSNFAPEKIIRVGFLYSPEERKLHLGGFTYNESFSLDKLIRKQNLIRVVKDEPLNIGACMFADGIKIELVDNSNRVGNSYSFIDYLKTVYYQEELKEKCYYVGEFTTKEASLFSRLFNIKKRC